MPNRDVTQRISGDILQHQLQLAKNATPGEWYDAGNGIIAAKRGARTPNPVAQVDNEKDAAHIIANSPQMVMSYLDEINCLHAKAERLENALAKAEADKASLRLALENIQGLSIITHIAVRNSGVDIVDASIEKITIAARTALAR